MARPAGHTQQEIGGRIGWSRDKVQGYLEIHSKCVADILESARRHQEGRATQDVAIATFNFTEGWFRNTTPLRYKERIAARAKENQLSGLIQGGAVCQKSDERIDTKKELARSRYAIPHKSFPHSRMRKLSWK